MSDIIVRLATLTDLASVQELNHELFVSDQRHFHDLNTEWPFERVGKEYFKKVIEEQGSACFIAEKDGEIIGYIAGGLQKEHTAYKGVRAELENMYIKEEFRSQGVGSELEVAFAKWCKDHNVDYLHVNAFAPNDRALVFYRKQGFSDYSVTLWKKL